MTHPEIETSNMKILIVDDDRKLCRLVADYLPKTFSSRALLARLRTVTRRYIVSERQAESESTDKTLIFGDLEIEQRSRTVRTVGYLFKGPEDQRLCT